MNAKGEFESKIGRLTKSKTYLNFCEEVYGYRMYLFNMMDREQLDFVFNSIPLASDDTLLDLGCGSGSIINRLVEKYGCQGIGIDLLENHDFAGKNNKSVRYIKGDIDCLSDYNMNPTVALSIDSLYFSNRFDNLLHTLCDLKSCKKYLFYSQYLFDKATGDRSILHRDNTSVACSLKRYGIPYEVIDYSVNEQLLYEKSLTALEKLRQDFINEGIIGLYESKLEETLLGKSLYDNGLASRFLYIVSL